MILHHLLHHDISSDGGIKKGIRKVRTILRNIFLCENRDLDNKITQSTPILISLSLVMIEFIRMLTASLKRKL